ncbi:hypothetical protein MRS76_18565 [Rhizobiaceae bacterium n13]|uniref:Uncharacterized protein n=1 Tax=Ferirhizobium litorale TaxID=2927786 RepID=A0AAE3QHS7_9HYPH|nr:hypothetical protein [Fererhizobium litorale]MDI7863957.1 hypothetical protein [Fererhizobium litorale]MDI7924210.1 hypothetical protein [Fererhizobium litorale]
MAQYLRSLESPPVRLADNRAADFESQTGLRGVIEQLGRIAATIDQVSSVNCDIETRTNGTAKLVFRTFGKFT